MIIPYKVLDIRHTQGFGWVIDGYACEKSILPISIPFDYSSMYVPGWDYNTKRIEIKLLFEKRLAEEYNEFITH